MPAIVYAEACAASPLENAGILLHVLNILGPGHHLFVLAVSKAWRVIYERVDSVEVDELVSGYYNVADKCAVTSKTTLYSAVFSSTSRVSLAYECDLMPLSDNLHHLAGRAADLFTLQFVHELGLPLTDRVLTGAAASGSVPKLQWLHVDQRCRLPTDITEYAARSGSIDAMIWVNEHCSELFSFRTWEGAAICAQVQVLQFLRDVGCETDEYACAAAARSGHVPTLKWLRERGYPWWEGICVDAAESGSVEMMPYLMQQGCPIDTGVLGAAAQHGHLAVCQLLVAEQCPGDTSELRYAAANGHLETVRFLHKAGYPWDPATICSSAAHSGNLELLRYLRQQGCVFSEDVMSAAAENGHLHICQYLFAEHCPWDTRACAKAARGSQLSPRGGGHLPTLRWLHEQGCPWDIQTVRMTAAALVDLPILRYMLSVEPAASAAQLTELLNEAGSCNRFAAAHLLRQQGAKWPAELSLNGRPWEARAVQWARDEGWTSPVPVRQVASVLPWQGHLI
jgi:Ankyrin repeats (3 copies)